MKPSPIVLLHELGQSVWLDNISDGLIQSGELARWIAEGSVYGVTSNPTIFKNAIGSDQGSYPAEIVRLATEGKPPEEIYEELAVRDITRTADLLLDAYRRGSGRDGFVSLEVSPDLAGDTAATIEQARRYWRRVNRPNLFVKVPGTPAGLPAIEALIAEGISVNVTLVFGRKQYAAVADAYSRGIEKRLSAGASLQDLHSVASLFVSRLDTAVDKELESKAGAAETTADRERYLGLRGSAAVANALDVWEEYRQRFFGAAFLPMSARGARPQWMLWASTGTKNAAYSDVKYVEELEGPDTINTMPRETLLAFLDHGVVPGNRLDPRVETARMTRRVLGDAGVSLEAHCAKLLDDGVEVFRKSYHDLIDVIRERSAALMQRR
ncbi:MAG TPA: transaldolase [Candidatus Limnocylindrales bacterium]|nr:transaldolase [Candidatus Limnocylindrales bacterium]